MLIFILLDVKSGDSKTESYFLKFMKSLLALFSSDKVMQEERWAFIIRLVSHSSLVSNKIIIFSSNVGSCVFY